MKIWLLHLSLFTHIVATLSLRKCPPGPMWGTRAKNTCQNTDRYHCLLDTDYGLSHRERYTEICLPPKRYKGVQFVYSGNLHARKCSSSRFSPEPTWSNTSTSFECPLLKSFCEEEGQVIAKNGTSSTDRSCRCDYRKMYNYVVKPADPCHCHPMEEDCSCYVNRCSSKSQILSPDYECVDKESGSTFVCSSIEEKTYSMEEVKTPVSENLTLSKSLIEISSYNIMGSAGELPFNKIALRLTLSMSIAGIVVGCLVVLLRQRCVTKRKLSEPKDPDHTESTVPEPTKHTVSKSTVIEPPVSEPVIHEPAHIEEIYRQRMMNSPFYIETKELNMLTKHFTNGQQSRFVILQGIHGTGKTQTSIRFCKNTKQSYSVVAMISPSEDVSLEEALLKLLTENLKINVPRPSNFTLDNILGELERFLNHYSRKGSPCLLVIEIASYKDKLKTVQKFVELLDSIPCLNLIFETVDKTLSSHFPKEYVITFDGMNANEYSKLFENIHFTEDTGEDENSIKKLVDTIGNLPLVLVGAIRYMKITGTSICEYCKMAIGSEERYFNAISCHKDESYQKRVLEMQTIPLKCIKNDLTEQPPLWRVFILMALLDYQSISVLVLEACYRHLTKCRYSIKREMIENLLNKIDGFSLCQTLLQPRITYKSGSSVSNNVAQGIRKRRTLKFHTITIKALEIVANIGHVREENIDFLLKTFCYEIDLDARTDFVVARNMLFFNHAEKLLIHIDKSESSRENTVLIHQAYLHCALGSTLLYQRENIESAHVHLMRARDIVLSIVGDKSIYEKNLCSGIKTASNRMQHEKFDIGKILEVADNILKFTCSSDFTKDFVFSKRRSYHDIDILKKEGMQKLQMFEDHYLSETDYIHLLEKDLVRSIEQIRKTFLIELVLWICQNNARALNELSYLIHETDPNLRSLKKTCHAECSLTKEFCKQAKERFQDLNIFVCLENDRSIHMLRRWTGSDTAIPKLEEDVKYFEAILISSNNIKPYFGFGFIKISSNSNFRHTSLCRRILLRYILHIFKAVSDEDKTLKRELYEKGNKLTKELLDQLEDVENENLIYYWLSVPFRYIQCAKFLQIACVDHKEALRLYKRALKFEEKRMVFWTRCIKESYIGQIECLFQLNKPEKAKQIYESVKAKIVGTNRENLIETFKELYERCLCAFQTLT